MRPNVNPIIARIEDLPYFSSPPIQLSLSQSASLSFGQYVWSNTNAPKTVLFGSTQLSQSTLLYIKSISFSADIPELDYQKALEITTTVAGNGTVAGTNQIPSYFKFLSSDAKAPTLRSPILCQKYFTDQEYKLLIEPKTLPNQVLGFFRGALQQTGALAGINTITLTAEFYVQTIEERNFINALKNQYPALDRDGYVRGR